MDLKHSKISFEVQKLTFQECFEAKMIFNNILELFLKVFLRFWGRGERYLRMETGVLLKISLRVS